MAGNVVKSVVRPVGDPEVFGLGMTCDCHLYACHFKVPEHQILTSVVNGFATAAGFTVAIVILAGIREKMEYNDVPQSFRGMPIVLVTAGLMAIAFCGFAGLLRG